MTNKLQKEFSKEHWRDLNVRDKIQEAMAVLLIMSGIVISFLSFFMNNYNIEANVLIYVAQAFLFGGSFMGLSIYFRSKFLEFNNTADKRIKEYNDNAEQALKK